MDVFLPIADEYVLDKLWAKLVPFPPLPDLVPLLLKQLSNATENISNASSSSPSSAWLPTFAAALPAPLQPPSAASVLLSISPPPTSLASISAWPRTYILRQIISITSLTLLAISLLYFLIAGLSYYYIFDHRMMRHPRFLKNQVKLEILCSIWAFPGMTALTLPWFLGEVRGYSKLYRNVDDYGWTYLILSVPFFLVFTDYCIYWIHRWLHIPVVYKHIHKPHHKWLIPTPFASHAFHPVDGYAQSIPYHLFVFLFPMHRYLYLGLFVGVNIWSVFIHDSDMFVSPNSKVEKFFNTPAHHTLHHLYFTCNYGQYFTMADRAGGSYRAPRADLDPLLEILAADKLKGEKPIKQE